MLPSRSYQLNLIVTQRLRMAVGALGVCEFPVGHYVYTGRAARNLGARLLHHLQPKRALHWHIDYLTHADGVIIGGIVSFTIPECRLNAMTEGDVLIPRFGASDCRSGCGSHLKFIAGTQEPKVPREQT